MKPKKFFSLRYKFIIFSLLLTIVPLCIAGVISDIKSTEVVQKQETALNLQTLQQIAQNLDFVVNEVNDMSLHLFIDQNLIDFMRDGDIPDNSHSIPNMQVLLNGYIQTKKYIFSIDMQSFNGQRIDTSGADDLIPPKEVQKIKALDGTGIWTLNSLYANTLNTTNTQVLSYTRLMRDVNTISKELGIIRINVSAAQIRNIFAQKIENGDFYIINRQHRIISSLDGKHLGDKINPVYVNSALYQNMEGYYTASIHHQKTLAIYYTIPDTGWKLLRLLPMDIISKQGTIIKRITLYSILISLLIAALCILFFNFKVLNPLKQVSSLMRNLENENFTVKMPTNGNDEIALLGVSFNKMSRRLDELINEVYAVKIKQREAEYEALVEQINPHFLYNTLDLIHWMSRMEDAFETSEMVQALSILFRLGLNNGEGLTTVKRELDHLRSYIVIQQKKYGEAVEFTARADPEVLDCTVVKLVLQPLVENAIAHGIEKNGGFGHIDIEIYREDERLIYKITDDGAGADENRIIPYIRENAKRKKGIGLKNVNDRIQLTFGYAYGVQFESEVGVGTTVTVVQPYTLGGKQDAEAIDRG